MPAVDGPISVAQCNQLRGLLVRCPHLHRKQVRTSTVLSGPLQASTLDTSSLPTPHAGRRRLAWLGGWMTRKGLCLSLDEVRVLLVLQEMDPNVLLQQSGKVLVRKKKKKEHHFHISLLGNFNPRFQRVLIVLG